MILSVPDDGYSRNEYVRTKFDIYVFILNINRRRLQIHNRPTFISKHIARQYSYNDNKNVVL